MCMSEKLAFLFVRCCLNGFFRLYKYFITLLLTYLLTLFQLKCLYNNCMKLTGRKSK